MNKIVMLLALILSSSAEAVPVKRLYQDVKLPTQNVLERQTITTPIVATTNYIKTTYAGPTSAAALTLSSFTHQPDVPRNITITPTGTTGDVESCAIVVTGTNIFNQTITETLTFAANDSTAQTGTKAFKTIASVLWPANCESGGFAATWVIGVGSVLGMKRCMATAGDVIHVKFDGASETVGTVTADASHVESNTYAPTGTPNAAKDVVIDFVQNFACFP